MKEAKPVKGRTRVVWQPYNDQPWNSGKKWIKGAAGIYEFLAIKGKLGNTKWTHGGLVSGRGGTIIRVTWGAECFGMMFNNGTTRRNEVMRVFCYSQGLPGQVEHEMLRSVPGTKVAIEKCGNGYVVVSRGGRGTFVVWQVSDQMFVRIDNSYDKGMVAAYVGRLGSVIPKDYKVSVDRWVLNEIRWRVGELDRCYAHRIKQNIPRSIVWNVTIYVRKAFPNTAKVLPRLEPAASTAEEWEYLNLLRHWLWANRKNFKYDDGTRGYVLKGKDLYDPKKLPTLPKELRGHPRPGSKPKPEPKAAHVEYLPGKVLCRLKNRAIKESSGVAASQVNPGVFWTHNDSGDAPRLYAFDKKGKDLGTFNVKGAHVDWEDMCSFRVGKKGYLLIADTGDNLRRRKSYRLYLYAEPKLTPDAKKLPEVKLLETLTFTYKGGASYDGESIAIDPIDRTVYLATRSRMLASCHIFTLPGYKPGSGARPPERAVAQPVGRLKLRNVTAMDISPDGRRAVLQTYLGGYQFLRRAKRTWKQAFAEKPRAVKLPWRAQGEGLCYGADGRTLYLTSEGARGCPLIEVPARKPAKK